MTKRNMAAVRTTSAKRPRFRLRDAEGNEVAVLGPILVIGRAAGCDLVLQGGLVSRQHARLTLDGDGVLVEDLGSRNGVLVNQRRICKPVLLGHGDVIGIGLESLEVVDSHFVERSDKLSTLPPPQAVVPAGEADVDVPELITVSAQLDVLTAREREVFELIVLGHTQREIAEKLHVSVKTVETHRARVAEKLECRTRAELVSYAIAAGMLRGR